MDHEKPSEKTAAEQEMRKILTPSAKRALAEAEARRLADKGVAGLPREINGRDGPEPIRYGDWEVKGLASDF
jgi:hypothetical protein